MGAGGVYKAEDTVPHASRYELGPEGDCEFQRVLDHAGVVGSDPIGVLAHLGLARAYTIQSDTTEARAEYRGFVNLWKDADPDIPILKQAEAEYAKLQ